MKAPYFEVFEDSDGYYRWHLKSANGRVIAQGESHSRERDAWRAVETVIATAYAFVDEGQQMIDVQTMDGPRYLFPRASS